MRRLLLVAVVAQAGCSAAEGPGGGDAGSPCTLSLSFDPAAPEVGQTVTLTAAVGGDGSGLYQLTWSVNLAGTEVAVDTLGPNGDVVSFAPTAPGAYHVTVGGRIGGLECAGDERDVNVRLPGAIERDYLLRIEPAAASDVAAQDVPITVPGGADYQLGDLSVALGERLSGAITGPDLAPLAADVLITPSGGDPLALGREQVTGADGKLELRLPGGLYDLLVVPAGPTVAPFAATSLSVAALAGALAAPAADLVSGTVTASGPLVGARVTVRVAGVPSTVGVSDASGGFTVGLHAGGPALIEVVPPDGSGLAVLEAQLVSVAGGDTIDVSFAAHATRTFDLGLRLPDGTTIAPGARARFLADGITGVGSVTGAGGPVTATGRVRLAAVADGAGNLPTVTLPRAIFRVIIEPAVATAGQAARQLTLDLNGLPPATFALAAPATATATVVDPAGAPVAGARVVALAGGDLAETAGAEASATSSATGAVSLDLAPETDYVLAVDATRQGHARVRLPLTTGLAASQVALGPLVLPPSLRVRAHLVIPGAGDLGRAHVSLLCVSCVGEVVDRIAAEGQSGAGGEVTLVVPDPGVAAR